ncbi:MAG TPA: hypothetical protein PK167_12495, partial [Prolixibacteraceae bacterium]|nr:hypothetical protein [Prolixibacteraceae bacterium]
MRNELILAILALVILAAEIFTTAGNKHKIITWSAVLFAAATVAGFLPHPEGELFGGSYRTDQMTVVMKNILNLGVLIVFLQSFDWLQRKENHDKISEYFLLVITTLMGMDFMISSGDFLMM